MLNKTIIMKRRIYLGLAALLVAAGTWAGRVAWRAHKDIVTLHVRSMPLADVIGRLERQTREKIVADSRLDTKLTLDVDSMPLPDVLDRIAEQAGGLVTTVHAVYESRTAMDKLLEALRSGDIAKANGWTNLAPRLSFLNEEPGPVDMNPDPSAPGEDRGKRQVVIVDRNIIVRRDGNSEHQVLSESSAPIIRFRGVSQGDGESAQEEIITPERIVMEIKLETRVKADAPLAPNHGAALAVARQVKGRCRTLYALQKSAAAALGAGAMRQFRSEFSSFGSTNASGRQVETTPEPPSMAAAEREARRANLSRFLNLTPEQRAQKAREQQEHNVRP